MAHPNRIRLAALIATAAVTAAAQKPNVTEDAHADRGAANHPPVVRIGSDPDLTLYAGQRVVIDASASIDPDGDALTFDWSHDAEAGSYRGTVELAPSARGAVRFTAPRVSARETVHIVLVVRDDGDPPRTAYARVVVTVIPAAVFEVER